MAEGTDQGYSPGRNESPGPTGYGEADATRELIRNGGNYRPGTEIDKEMTTIKGRQTNIYQQSKTIWAVSTDGPLDEHTADPTTKDRLDTRPPIANTGQLNDGESGPPQGEEMSEGSDALSVPRPDLSDPSDDDPSIALMTYFFPFRVDLLKTEWNPNADPEKWIKRIFAIVKNADKSAALLAHYDHEGNRRRYKEVSDVPRGSEMGFRIKRKQYRTKIQTLFAEFETVMTPKEVKLLDGIKNLNANTPVFRADRYSGEPTRSVCWLMGVHPTLTHSESLTREIEKKLKKINIKEEIAREFQDRLPQYDHRKNKPWEEIQIPPFHLTTEDRIIEEKGKKTKVRVLAIHTAASAAPMLHELLSELGSSGELETVPSDGRRSLGEKWNTKALSKHWRLTTHLTAVAIYKIDQSVMARKIMLKDGTLKSLADYIKESVRAIGIEKTNATESEGKYLVILDKKEVQMARKWVVGTLPKIYKKYLNNNEIKERKGGPRLSYEADSSQHMGSWKDILVKSLKEEEKCEKEDERTQGESYGEEPDRGDDGWNVITKKKRKINNKKALRRRTEYKNPHHETEPTEGTTDGDVAMDEAPKKTSAENTDEKIKAMIQRTVGKEIPRIIEIKMQDMHMAIENQTQGKHKTMEEERDKQTAEQRRLLLMIEDMKSDLDQQREETKRVQKELTLLQETNKKEADARIKMNAEQNKRMEDLGKMIRKTFEEGERRREIERQITQENIKQLVSGELHTARVAWTREQVAQTDQMNKIFREAQQLFQKEANSLTNQFAQTLLDVKGLQTKVQNLDEDLQATSVVAASTSGYLEKATEDYSPPEGVDYENVITPSSTPAKPSHEAHLTERSPLLGVAGHEC